MRSLLSLSLLLIASVSADSLVKTLDSDDHAHLTDDNDIAAGFRSAMNDIAQNVHQRKLLLANDELTTEDREAILGAHNDYRSQLALGRLAGVGSFPSATNMNELLWDPCLEAVASDYARTCVWGHNGNRAAQTVNKCTRSTTLEKWPIPSGLNWLGENLAARCCGTPVLSGFQASVTSWWDELDDYGYGQQHSICSASDPDTCNGVCGHFTAMAWATTRYVGCAYAHCTGGLRGASSMTYMMVCEYYPGGNMCGDYPYESGTPASNCEADRTANSDTGLCGGGVNSNFQNDGGGSTVDDCWDSTDGTIAGGQNLCGPTAPVPPPTPMPTPSPTPQPVTPAPVPTQQGQTPLPTQPTPAPVGPAPDTCTKTCSGSNPCVSFVVEIVFNEETSDLWAEYTSRGSRGNLFAVQQALVLDFLAIDDLCDASRGYSGPNMRSYSFGDIDTIESVMTVTCNFYDADNACRFYDIAKDFFECEIPGERAQMFSVALKQEYERWAAEDVGSAATATISVTYTEDGADAANIFTSSDSGGSSGSESGQINSHSAGEWFTFAFTALFVGVLCFFAGWCIRQRKANLDYQKAQIPLTGRMADQQQQNIVVAVDGGTATNVTPDVDDSSDD